MAKREMFEYKGYKIDDRKGETGFNIFDNEDNVVGTVRINKTARKNRKTAMLTIYDKEKNPVLTPEQNRTIVELFSRYTVSNKIEPTYIIHSAHDSNAWDGVYPSYINKSIIGVPKNIEGEFVLITTSPDNIPCIVSQEQRKELINQGFKIYGIPVSFMPYNTNNSIKDKIFLKAASSPLGGNYDRTNYMIINNRDDLENSKFIKTDYLIPRETEREKNSDIKIRIDNKNNIPVDIHGIDDVSGEHLNISYKQKSSVPLDFSNVNKLDFDFLDTPQSSKVFMLGNPLMKEQVRKIIALKKKTPSSVRNLKARMEDKYRKTVAHDELNLYKTLKTIKNGIGDSIKINYDKHPLNAKYIQYDESIKAFIKDYERDHKDELKKDSLIKDISI